MKTMKKQALCRGVRAAGCSRERGVKAVEGYRSPSPGRTRERLGAKENPGALRRRLSETGGGLVGMHEIPESR
jgi:hypothetical protein